MLWNVRKVWICLSVSHWLSRLKRVRCKDSFAKEQKYKLVNTNKRDAIASGWHVAGKVCNSFRREGICSQPSVHNTNNVILIFIVIVIVTKSRWSWKRNHHRNQNHDHYHNYNLHYHHHDDHILFDEFERGGRASIVGKVDQPRFWPVPCYRHHHVIM